jgi:ankyrin repeat protein
LHAAAIFGDLPLVELLLGRGARADLGNDQGKTPLDIAAEQGHDELAERLESQLPGS